MGRRIYSEIDVRNVEKELLGKLNKSVMAAAFTIRDNMRAEFKKDGTKYKYHTSKFDRMAEGINVGKMRNGTVVIHAMGNRENDGTWKTRFFVGGTKIRKQSKENGKRLEHPYTKGYLSSLDSVEKGMRDAQQILNTYVEHVINE